MASWENYKPVKSEIFSALDLEITNLFVLSNNIIEEVCIDPGIVPPLTQVDSVHLLRLYIRWNIR